MKISVIVPSHNEKKDIAECLDRLLDQTRKPDEIIVVDDSTDKTPEIVMQKVTALKSRGDETPKFFHFDKIGLPAAKNFAWKKATGDIIVFFDADMILDRNVIEAIEHKFQNPDVKLAVVTTREPELRTFIQKCLWVKGKHFGWAKREQPPMPATVYRKEVLEDLGGWNENIYFYFEDRDMGERIRNKGYKIEPITEAHYMHLDPTTMTDYVGATKKTGRGIMEYGITKLIKDQLFVFSPLYWLALMLVVAIAIIAYFTNDVIYAILIFPLIALMALGVIDIVVLMGETKMFFPVLGYVALSFIKPFLFARSLFNEIQRRMKK